MTVYLGIDPGASGGFGLISGTDAMVNAMPHTERDIWEFICHCKKLGCFAFIEKVQGYIGKEQPGSRMFQFGQSYGGLRMALIAADIPSDDVTPQKWQKALGIVVRGKTETKTEFKGRLKAKAQQLFPSVKITLATADALLIAEYCRRIRSNI